jgi:hypothetical protein
VAEALNRSFELLHMLPLRKEQANNNNSSNNIKSNNKKNNKEQQLYRRCPTLYDTYINPAYQKSFLTCFQSPYLKSEEKQLINFTGTVSPFSMEKNKE